MEADLVEVTCSEEESFQKLENGELDAYITVDSFTSEYFVEPGHALPVCKIGSSDFYFAVIKKPPGSACGAGNRDEPDPGGKSQLQSGND